MMAQAARVLGYCVSLIVLLGGLGLWSIGTETLTPQRRPPGPPPVGAEVEVLASARGHSLVGWVAPAATDAPYCGAALLMHGRKGDRSDMAGRADLLIANGFTVALFDFEGHGESGGDMVGYGLYEADNALRMAAALRGAAPDDAPLAVVGWSLGAAAAIIAGDKLEAKAFVLEAPFNTLHETTARRAVFAAFQETQAYLFHLQTPYRLGYAASDVRPVEAVSLVSAPKLFISGAEDPVATPSQLRDLLAAAQAPKRLVFLDDAVHEDLYAFDPAGYRDAVLPFLKETLCPDV